MNPVTQSTVDDIQEGCLVMVDKIQAHSNYRVFHPGNPVGGGNSRQTQVVEIGFLSGQSAFSVGCDRIITGHTSDPPVHVLQGVAEITL